MTSHYLDEVKRSSDGEKELWYIIRRVIDRPREQLDVIRTADYRRPECCWYASTLPHRLHRQSRQYILSMKRSTGIISKYPTSEFEQHRLFDMDTVRFSCVTCCLRFLIAAEYSPIFCFGSARCGLWKRKRLFQDLAIFICFNKLGFISWKQAGLLIGPNIYVFLSFWSSE